MIESSQTNDMRYNKNRYNNQSSYNGQYGNAYNQGYDYQEDEPLDNYLAVQDADNIAVDKSYSAIPNEYYYTGEYCLYYVRFKVNYLVII